MSDPFLGEVRLAGFSFAPRGWALCDGQIMPINQNQSLYSLLGTTYGGDGRNNFALPDMRGRTPIHEDNAHKQGQAGGSASETLTLSQVPSHTHQLQGVTTPADNAIPDGAYWCDNQGQPYNTPVAGQNMAADTISHTGGQAHNNMQPYLAVTFLIALQGTFPSRS